jgi:hypothetical protein
MKVFDIQFSNMLAKQACPDYFLMKSNEFDFCLQIINCMLGSKSQSNKDQ